MKRRRFFFLLPVVLLLQIAVFTAFPVLDIHYEMLFATVIFMAIRFDWRVGYQSGIWCGMSHDLFSIAPFGLTLLVYGTAAILAASFQKVIFTQHISTRLFILFTVSVLAALPLTLYRYGADALFHQWSIFYAQMLAVATVNTLFSIPYYHFLERLFHDDRYA